MGIYLVDVFGNEILLHAEGPGCYDPMPLKPQPRPPVLPARCGLRQQAGLLPRGRRLSRHAHAGRETRIGQEAARGRVAREAALVARGLVRPGLHRPRYELAQPGEQADPGHGAGRGGRLGLLSRAGRHVRLFPAPGRQRHDDPVDAERSERSCRRGGVLRGLPRPAAGRAAGEPAGRPAPGFAPRPQDPPAVARPAARVQLHGRGAAGFDQALRALPRLRPRGRQEAEPRCRPHHDLQYGLRRTVAQGVRQVRRAPGRPRFSRPTRGARIPASSCRCSALRTTPATRA